MEVLTVLVSVTLVTLGTSQTDCPDGSQPSSCDLLEDPCLNNTCIRFPEAACMADPCNQCAPLFYHHETGTKLKCNDERLRCVSCSDFTGSTCGGPGIQANLVVCDPQEVCGVLRASIAVEVGILPVFYRGCVATSAINDGNSSCYDNDDVADSLSDIVDGGTVVDGYGCACTEDVCNNFDLDSYPNEDLPSCVASGVWFNPGEFLNTSGCEVSFCDSTGEITCFNKATSTPMSTPMATLSASTESPMSCTFGTDGEIHQDGDWFKSGCGNCMCNRGIIQCFRGQCPDLICVDGITVVLKFCEDDSVCYTKHTFLALTSGFLYEGRCLSRADWQYGNDSISEDGLEQICSDSLCNYPQPFTQEDCEYNGETYAYLEMYFPDECNSCTCVDGNFHCTDVPCNGPLCLVYSDNLVIPSSPRNVTCRYDEVCANATDVLFRIGGSGDAGFCLPQSIAPDLGQCVQDSTLVDPYVNLGIRAVEVCTIGATVTPSISPPTALCFSSDGTMIYEIGEKAQFGCEQCVCSLLSETTYWDCANICEETTFAPTSASMKTQISCTFGTGEEIYEDGDLFKSGCGNCVCNKGTIQCFRGQCPDLICVDGISITLKFCETDSVCHTKETFLPFASVFLYTRRCLLRSDWQYGNNSISEDGSEYICSDSLCNYPQPSTQEDCEYNGETYAYLEMYFPDECNSCTCVDGNFHCTDVPCNGPFCSVYSDNLVIPSSPRNVTCMYDEVCASATDVLYITGGIGNAGFCLPQSIAPDLGQCVQDSTLVDPYVNLGVRAAEVCTIGATVTPPPALCFSSDGAMMYEVGESTQFGCEQCVCSVLSDTTYWDCTNICEETTFAPTSASMESYVSCSFGTGGEIYEDGDWFKSGCGNCVCNDGTIQCFRGQCPDLICVDGNSITLKFCEEDSVCYTKETFLALTSGFLYEGRCLLRSDWQYGNDSMSEDGSEQICIDSLCNYPQPFTQADCEYNGETYGYLEMYFPDECNSCTCIDGTFHCTDVPCNGPFCLLYSDNLAIPSSPRNVTCRYDEVCANATDVLYRIGGTGDAGFCLPQSVAPDLGQCVQNSTLVDLYVIFAIRAVEVCTIGATVTPSISPPPALCFSSDGTMIYEVGESAQFGCEQCVCSVLSGKTHWDCMNICIETTTATTSISTNPLLSCTFGTDEEIYKDGDWFESGCGNCVCNNGSIQCFRGQCPDLICVDGVVLKFCENDSVCYTKQTFLSITAGFVYERRCLLRPDWQYGNDSISEDGFEQICSDSLCNYPQPFTQDDCEYNGETFAYLEMYFPDECNTCTCVGGDFQCTDVPCNGPLCSVYSNNPLVPSSPRNVTCRYHEVCANATDVLYRIGGTGEAAGFCLPKSIAPELGKCVQDSTLVDPHVRLAIRAEEVCTIGVSTIIPAETSTNIGIISSTTEANIEMTTAKEELTKPIREKCLTKEKNPVPVDGNIAVDGCTCTCRRDINKEPSLSCLCKIEVEIRFEFDFSLVENTLEDFKREIINELAQTLGLDKTSIQDVKVLKGSIVVRATIISDSSKTREDLETTVNDGSLQVNHKGMIFTADSLTVRSPDDEESSDSRRRPFFYVLISLAAVIGAVFLIVIVCKVYFTFKKKEEPAGKASYHVPPVELDLDEKPDSTRESPSNDYQRALTASEITTDYQRAINLSELTTDYQKAIDPSETEREEPDQKDNTSFNVNSTASDAPDDDHPGEVTDVPKKDDTDEQVEIEEAGHDNPVCSS